MDFAIVLAASVAGACLGVAGGALAVRRAPVNHTPWPGSGRKPRPRRAFVNHGVAPALARAAAGIALAIVAVVALVVLAGCAGGGPFGTGLGEVVGNISVTDPAGNTCTVAVTNGKDQTNLELEGLHVCGASIDRLHADRSDGAQAAINANAQVMTSLGGQLIGLLGSAITMLGVPTGPPTPTKPPVVVVPPPPPAARPSLMMLEAPDL